MKAIARKAVLWLLALAVVSGAGQASELSGKVYPVFSKFGQSKDKNKDAEKFLPQIEEILAQATEDGDAQIACYSVRSVLKAVMGDFASATEDVKKMSTCKPSSPQTVANSLSWFQNYLYAFANKTEAADYINAVGTLFSSFENYPGDDESKRVKYSAMQCTSALNGFQGKIEEKKAKLEAMLKEFKDQDNYIFLILGDLAVTYNGLKDTENALANYAAAFALASNKVATYYLAQRGSTYVDLARKAGKSKECQEVLAKAYENIVPSEAKLCLALNYAKVLTDVGDGAKAVAVCKEAMSSQPQLYTYYSRAQMAIVDACMDTGDFAQAVKAAKTAYDLARTSAELDAATKALGRAIKAADGNLVRLNDFLKFQKFGPDGEDKQAGTGDDLKNPLAGLLAEPKGEELASVEKAINELGAARENRKARGYLYLFSGSPQKALAEFKMAYRLCAIDEAKLQDAVDDVIMGLKAATGHVFAGERFYEFHTYGPKGKDGKSNLIDPLEEIRG